MDKSKTCFIITPIGGNLSNIRRHADGVIDAVIAPVLERKGYEIIVAHRITDGGSITRQVIQKIIDADLVVANLSGLNPNVMYELAIRHAIRKPLIQICEEGTQLPFDINEERTIFYTNDMQGVVELTNNFEKMIDPAVEDQKPDNPIYRAIKLDSIIQKEDISSTDKYLITRMDELESKVLKAISLKSNGNISSSMVGNGFIKKRPIIDEKLLGDIYNEIFKLGRNGILSTQALKDALSKKGIEIPKDVLSEIVLEFMSNEENRKQYNEMKL